MGPSQEHELAGGNVAGRVVRAGATVRKPADRATPAVHALLGHLQASGFDGAPHALGIDGDGRQILEFVPGSIAYELGPMPPEHLHRVGALIRRLHDATATFAAPPGADWDVVIPPDRHELVCHNDLAPWNLVCDRERWVFIDWDGAGPGSRLWDLAYAAHGFVPLSPGGDPDADAPRLRALIDGYGLDERERHALPPLIEAQHARHARPPVRGRDQRRAAVGAPARGRPRGALGSRGRLHRRALRALARRAARLGARRRPCSR